MKKLVLLMCILLFPAIASAESTSALQGRLNHYVCTALDKTKNKKIEWEKIGSSFSAKVANNRTYSVVLNSYQERVEIVVTVGSSGDTYTVKNTCAKDLFELLSEDRIKYLEMFLDFYGE